MRRTVGARASPPRAESVAHFVAFFGICRRCGPCIAPPTLACPVCSCCVCAARTTGRRRMPGRRRRRAMPSPCGPGGCVRVPVVRRARCALFRNSPTYCSMFESCPTDVCVWAKIEHFPAERWRGGRERTAGARETVSVLGTRVRSTPRHAPSRMHVCSYLFTFVHICSHFWECIFIAQRRRWHPGRTVWSGCCPRRLLLLVAADIDELPRSGKSAPIGPSSCAASSAHFSTFL